MKNVRDEIRLKCYTGKCAQIKKKKISENTMGNFSCLNCSKPKPKQCKK